jgi:outer membrane protein assembly factor BamB
MRSSRLPPPVVVAFLVALFLALGGVLALPGAAAASSGSWLQFHYAATKSGYDPLETTLNAGNVGGLTARWHTSLGDTVLGTPLVSGDRVVVQGVSGRLYALSLSDGRRLWTTAVIGSGFPYTPAIWSGLVIVAAKDAHGAFVAAYDIGSGGRRWHTRVTLGQDAELTSPAIYGSTIYFSAGGTIYALSASKGRVLWTSKVATSSDGWVNGPLAISGGGEYVVGASLDGHVFALTATTGAMRWNVLAGGGIYHGGPAIYSGIVYVPEGRSGTEGGGFDIVALQVSDGHILWRGYAGDDVHITPAAGAGIVVIGSVDEGIRALNYKTGTELWAFPYEGEVWGAPVIANGVVYAGTDQQLVIHSAADGAALFSTVIAENSASWSSPSVVDGRVYMGSPDGVWSFGLP